MEGDELDHWERDCDEWKLSSNEPEVKAYTVFGEELYGGEEIYVTEDGIILRDDLERYAMEYLSITKSEYEPEI